MTALTHSFSESLKVGTAHEAELDAALSSRGWDIERATMTEQLSGIDRWIAKQGVRRSVEYKSDVRSSETGRYALELVSSVSDSMAPTKEGWALRCGAEWLILYRPAERIAHVVKADDMHAWARRWLATRAHTMAAVRNLTWTSIVLLVPCSTVDAVAKQRIEVTP